MSLTADVNPTPALTLKMQPILLSPSTASALLYEHGFSHIPNKAGTGHPSFWKEIGIVPCPSFAPPRTPPCCSAAPALPRQDYPALTAPQGMCPSPWCPAGLELLVCCALGTGPFTLTGISAFHGMAGSQLWHAWEAAGRGRPASSREHSEPCAHTPFQGTRDTRAPPSALPTSAWSHAQI